MSRREWFDTLSRLEVIDRLGPEIRERLADGEIDLREAVEELNQLYAGADERHRLLPTNAPSLL